MKRFLPLLAVVLLAATADETRLWRVARATLDDKLYDVAERQFAEFLQKFPQSDRADHAQLLVGEAQVNQGKWTEAVATLTEGMTRWPDKRADSFRFWLAEALARGGKFTEAEKRYREVVDQFVQSPYRGQALYGVAFALLKQGRLTEATAALDQLEKLAPKGDLALEAEMLRGQVAFATGQFAAADAVLTGVLTKTAGTRAYYRAEFWLGESLARQRRFVEALERTAVVTDAFAAKPGRPVDAQLAAEAWFATGWLHWETQAFDKAATAFAAALTNAVTVPLKRDALLKLGEASARAGKLTEGVARLKEFLQAHPQDAVADEVQLAIGDLLLRGNAPAAALAEYAKLIATYPQSGWLPQAQFNAGACAWQLHQPAEALRYYQQAAAAKDPALAVPAAFKVADAQFALGQFADAVESYQKLIGSQPNLPALDRAMFQLGLAFWRLRNTDGATTALESLVKQFPASPVAAEAQFVLGQVWASAGQESQARAAFQRLVENFPQSAWATKAALAIGESFQREGQLDAAVAEYNKLMAAGLDSDLAQRAFYRRGWCYAQQGQVARTVTEFAEFLKQHPQATLAPEVQFWIGEHYLKEKDYLKAQAQFQTLVTSYPTNALADSAQYMAGRAAYARQDYKGAIDLYEALLKTYTNSTFRCDARFAQGDALSELGQFDDALLVFDSVVKDFPDCYLACEAHGRRGDCQYTLNRYDDASLSYRKALDCAKDAAARNQALFKLGQCAEKAGKLDDALAAYTKPVYESAVAPDPTEPPERFWACKAARAAADIKERQQQWRDAITLYEKLATLCPDMKELALDRVRKLRVEHVILF